MSFIEGLDRREVFEQAALDRIYADADMMRTRLGLRQVLAQPAGFCP